MVLPSEYQPLLISLNTLNPRSIARALAIHHPEIVRAATTRLIEEDMTLLKADVPENPLYPADNADDAREKMMKGSTRSNTYFVVHASLDICKISTGSSAWMQQLAMWMRATNNVPGAESALTSTASEPATVPSTTSTTV